MKIQDIHKILSQTRTYIGDRRGFLRLEGKTLTLRLAGAEGRDVIKTLSTDCHIGQFIVLAHKWGAPDFRLYKEEQSAGAVITLYTFAFDDITRHAVRKDWDYAPETKKGNQPGIYTFIDTTNKRDSK